MTDQSPPKPSQPNQDEPNKQSIGSRETIAPNGLDHDSTNSGPFPSLPVMFGRFEIRKHLGKGAMGTVYLAFDPELNKPEINNQVAIKIPLLQTSDDSTLLERFCREAQATGAMNHPNICKLYEVGEINGTHYISMEYIDGRQLAEYIGAGQEPQLPRQVAGIIRKLAEGLAHAHERGFIHRDLQPTNVMIATNGQPKIMDFGLARRFGVTGDIRLTQSNTIIGSPAYMSPEQARSENDTLTPASDIYSLGTLFFELLTCELPFKGPMAVVLGMIALNRVPKPSSVRPDVDPRLEALCLKMLEKKVESRPKSMTEVAAALTEWLRPAATKSNPVMSLVEEPVALTPKKPAAPRADKTDGIENQKRRVTDLLDKHEYGAAISHLEKMTHLKDARFAPLVAWAKPKLKEVRATEQQRRESSAPSCDTAEQLFKHYDYAGAVALLTAVPFAYRSIELRDLLNKATELHDECEHLQRSIEEAIHTGDKNELPGLVKGLLKLKPNNKAIKQLAAEVKELGAAKVIARRKGQRQTFDPAGRVVEPSQIVLAVLAIVVIFVAVSFTARNYYASGKKPGHMPSPDVVKPPVSVEPKPTTPPKPDPHGGESELDPLSQTLTSKTTGMKLAFIPAGSFLMGSPAAEASRSLDEGPQHLVQITKPFQMGIHEVTQSQYQMVMGNNPSLFSKIGNSGGLDPKQFPVEHVSWFDAIEFCNKLSEKDGLPLFYTVKDEFREGGLLKSALVTSTGSNGYRLPTEAEWEYACRAKTTSPFHFGNTSNGSESNVDGNSPYETSTKNPPLERTTTVGSFKPNAFGLFDMHGNVAEWCFDCYGFRRYADRTGTAAVDPVNNSGQPNRILRGGSHFDYAYKTRSAYRYLNAPAFVGEHVGFRVVRNASGVNNGNKGAATVPVPPSFAGVTAGDGKELVPGMKFHWCPEGSFTMGSPSSEPGRGKNEDEVSVTLSSGFWLGETEVTQGQWQALMKTTPWRGRDFVKDGSDYPAGYISRGEADYGMLNADSASEFCSRLTLQERTTGRLPANWKFALPTEAQWEYACRADTKTKYSFGADAGRLGEHAWYAQNTNPNDRHAERVGLKKPNPWGLRDMHGNVWEWCADRYGDKLTGGSNPRGASSGSIGVYRGGCFFDDASFCRTAYRNNAESGTRFAAIGFRVAGVLVNESASPAAAVMDIPQSVVEKGTGSIAPTLVVPPVTQVLYFGGNDWIEIPRSTYPGKTPLTLEAIVRPDINRRQTVIANFDNSGFGLEMKYSKWNFTFHDFKQYQYATSNDPVEINKTVHLSAVFDKGETALFVDGKRQFTTAKIVGGHRPSLFSFKIGADPNPKGGVEHHWIGFIYAVRVSLQARYTKDFPPPLELSVDRNALAVYDMSRSVSGTVLRDLSGNGFDGTIHGAKLREAPVWKP